MSQKMAGSLHILQDESSTQTRGCIQLRCCCFLQKWDTNYFGRLPENSLWVFHETVKQHRQWIQSTVLHITSEMAFLQAQQNCLECFSCSLSHKSIIRQDNISLLCTLFIQLNHKSGLHKTYVLERKKITTVQSIMPFADIVKHWPTYTW